MENTFALGWIDHAIMLIYFIFVLGIGWALKKFMRSATDFLEAGRSLPAWVTGLAFISANLGALEVMGMAASGAKYGMMTVHFYWIGAIPAMIFLAIFMMPFYYGSKARSVPEYLKLRFDEKTRGFNAFAFAFMTIMASGASMHVLALLAEQLLGWDYTLSLIGSAAIVLVYTYLGGLSSAIYNEVLQFFLIVIGFLPLVFISLKAVGGWEGVKSSLDANMLHSWKYAANPGQNPMGVEWMGIIVGLGFVLSFGYWCTNFLVVQRAMAAGSMGAARRTPLIGAVPKMFIPFLVILPGIIAAALLQGDQSFIPFKEGSETVRDFDKVMPVLLMKYLPTGVLGLGVTALMASFMSGMAGNVTAFNTVFTYDIYQSYINPNKSDKHYLNVGQVTTIAGVLVSILAAYVARQFNNIMDFLQLIFAFINAPLFATFLLGMFTKRTTGHAAFWGLLSGTFGAAIHHGLTVPAGAVSLIKGGWLTGGIQNALHTYPSEMAQNFWTAIFAFALAFILTLVISAVTKRNKTDEELKGLVYSLTPKVHDDSKYWYEKPRVLAIIIGAVALVLSILFW
ncbi:MAG: sodium:solute symporter family protein [Bacteroidales bacterium]